MSKYEIIDYNVAYFDIGGRYFPANVNRYVYKTSRGQLRALLVFNKEDLHKYANAKGGIAIEQSIDKDGFVIYKEI